MVSPPYAHLIAKCRRSRAGSIDGRHASIFPPTVVRSAHVDRAERGVLPTVDAEEAVVRASRLLYVVLAWLFVAGLVFQVFLIGLGLFGDPAYRAAHAGFGWLLHLWPLLVVVFAALSRAGSRHWQWALALAVVVFLVPIF